MKKIITALLNETVNNKLRTYKEIQVIMNDIQYQEGIIEALEINFEIEYIILSELLPGELDIKNLIEKIKQIKNEIKIIIILEKQNKELENYLFSKGNINIFYNNEIEIKKIAELIIDRNKNEELELEIQKLKEIIMNQKENNKTNIIEKNIDKENINKKQLIQNKTDNKILISENEKKEIENEIEKEYKKNYVQYKITHNKIIKNIMKIFNKETVNEKSKLIIISGISGIGKSIFTINLAKSIEKQKKKILILDFDFLNNSMKTLFGIEKKVKEEKNKINSKIFINSKTQVDNINQVNDWNYINTLSGINNKKKYESNNINSTNKKNEINYMSNTNENNIKKINCIENINKKIYINNLDNNDIEFTTKRNDKDNKLKIKMEKLIININSNIKLISNINTIFEDNKINDLQLLKIIKEVKIKYDFILIDTNQNDDYLKSIMEEVHKIIFLTEPNILQIKKSKKLLDIYTDEWKIDKEKIYILFNKVKNDSLSFNILKETFKNYNIIGKINFINNCNTLINQNMKSLFLENNIKEQYKNVAKKINENNKVSKYYINKINTT